MIAATALLPFSDEPLDLEIEQDLPSASHSEESSPAGSCSSSCPRSVASVVDAGSEDPVSNWVPTLRSSRSMTLCQGLPKLTVHSSPYPPTSQPESRNESPDRRPSIVTPSPLHNVAFPRVSPPTRSPEEMIVDLVKESGSDAALRAAGLKVLDLRSANIDTNLAVLVCVTCEGAVHPKSPVVHAQTHGIKLTKQNIADLTKLLPTLRLATENKDFPHPTDNQAPVDHIKLWDGLQCQACSYCCRSCNMMDSHWSAKHRGEGSADCLVCKV